MRTGHPCLGSLGSGGPPSSETGAFRVGCPRGAVWRSLGGWSVVSGRVWRKNPSRPRGPPGPPPTRGGGLRAGTRSRGPALASGEMSPLRPRGPLHQGGTPRPFSLAGAPTSSTPGARERPPPPLYSPRTAPPTPRCPQPRITSGKALGPRVRPRHPPGRPRDSVRGVAFRPPPSAPAHFGRPAPRPRPAALSTPGRTVLRSPSSEPCPLSARVTWTCAACRLARGRPHFAQALRAGSRPPPWAAGWRAVDPGASGLWARRRGSTQAWREVAGAA